MKYRADKYILNEQGQAVPEYDLMTWAMWFEERTNRVVKQEWVENVKISTVFLGLDHNFNDDGPPILWETMAFSNNKLFQCESNRCAGDRDQAEAMHEEMKRIVKVRLAAMKNLRRGS